jgi:hypothetical protein
LFAGNDKGFGVDAAAQNVHGCGGVVESVLNLGRTPPQPSPC